MEDRIQELFGRSREVQKRFATESASRVRDAARAMTDALRSGRKLLFFGNGGSACDASHLAAEFVNRFREDRVALPALALNTDMAVLTSIANDYSFDRIFRRQIEAFGIEGDVAVGITTSGSSENVLQGIREARHRRMTVIVLTGEKGRHLEGEGDFVFVVPTTDTPRVQECHIALGHVLCELVEEMLQQNPGAPG